MRCPTCGHDPRPSGPPSIAAHLYVTDVDRSALVIPGDTMIEREHNASEVILEARARRLIDVLAVFCERCDKSAPPFADESALSNVRGVIRAMVSEGLLHHDWEPEMVTSVCFAERGGVTGHIVSMFGEVIT